MFIPLHPYWPHKVAMLTNRKFWEILIVHFLTWVHLYTVNSALMTRFRNSVCDFHIVSSHACLYSPHNVYVWHWSLGRALYLVCVCVCEWDPRPLACSWLRACNGLTTCRHLPPDSLALSLFSHSLILSLTHTHTHTHIHTCSVCLSFWWFYFQ